MMKKIFLEWFKRESETNLFLYRCYFFIEWGYADIYVTHEDKVEFNVFDGEKEPTATNILPID